jgi:hypothetical protein
VDKSPKQRTVLAKEWWPGRELNTRHADFQGVTLVSCNHLIGLDVAYLVALQIPITPALVCRINLLDSPSFATANLASEVQP